MTAQTLAELKTLLPYDPSTAQGQVLLYLARVRAGKHTHTVYTRELGIYLENNGHPEYSPCSQDSSYYLRKMLKHLAGGYAPNVVMASGNDTYEWYSRDDWDRKWHTHYHWKLSNYFDHHLATKVIKFLIQSLSVTF